MSLEAIGNFGLWTESDERVRSSSGVISNLVVFFKTNISSLNVRNFSHSSVFLVNATKSNDVDQNQNQEAKKYTGKQSASIEAEQDLKGVIKADATLKIEKELTDGFSWSVDVGAILKQGEEIEVSAKGKIKIGGEF